MTTHEKKMPYHLPELTHLQIPSLRHNRQKIELFIALTQANGMSSLRSAQPRPLTLAPFAYTTQPFPAYMRWGLNRKRHARTARVPAWLLLCHSASPCEVVL